MAYDFPNSPTLGQAYGNYVWDGEKWQLPKGPSPDRATIYAAPFDALAYNGMQVNGSMEVSQENGGTAVGSTPGGFSERYIVDGWRGQASTSTAVLSYQQVASSVPGIAKCCQFTVSTAQASLGGTDYVRFTQHIEGYRFSRVAWGTASAMPATVGFWVRANLSGTYRALMLSSDSLTLTPWMPFTIVGGAAFQWVTITFPAQTTGAWNTDNTKGATLMFEMASSATPNILASTSGYASITGVVVLPGIEAPSAARSPLIMRPYDQELVTCKRYFQKISAQGSALASGLGYLTGWGFPLPVEMRASPTASVLGTLTWTTATLAFNIVGITNNYCTPTTWSVNPAASVTVPTNMAVSVNSNGFCIADARL